MEEQQQDLRGDRVDSLFPSDPQPPFLDASATELARTSSDSSSAITVENNNNTSTDLSHHCAAPSPFPDQSTRWTNQQHHLYLNSLEASFVNELHRSMHLRGWSLQNNIDKASKPKTLQNSPKMLWKKSLALQDGCCKKINLERIEPTLESTADSHVLAESQLGLTSVERGSSLSEPNASGCGLLCHEGIHARGSSTLFNKSQKSLEKQCNCHSSHLELVDSTTEVSDQNFKDGEARSNSMPMAKKLKTAAADASSNDQVVPFGNFHTTYVSTSTNSTSENEGHKFLSEFPESFGFPKPDLPYFLSGSC